MSRQFKAKYISANEALTLRFDVLKNAKKIEHYNNLAEYCLSKQAHAGIETSALYKTYLYIQRLLINRALVDVEILSLSPLEQSFVYFAYKDKMPFDVIASHLNYNKSRVSDWNTKILSDLDTLLSYSLAPTDVFSFTKTLNLVQILEQRINSFNSNFVYIDPGFIDSLVQKRNKYKKLLNFMGLFLNFEDVPDFLKTKKGNKFMKDPKFHATIREKLLHPHNLQNEIASKLNFEEYVISRHLKTYRALCKPYIN